VDRPGVLFINFGGPQGPDELEPFLRNLFDDVLPLPNLVKSVAVPAIASRRSKTVGENYAEIGWSPLVPMTLKQVDAVRQALGSDAPPIAVGMQYTAPTLEQALDELDELGVDRLVAIAMFPHWSFATIGSAFEMLHEALEATGRAHWPVHHAPAFYDHPRYLDALASTITRGVESLDGQGPVHLLFTPHGLPLSLIRKGDPYPDHVRETVRRVIDHLGWTDPVHVGWQSRVGPVKWLEPSTEQVIRDLGQAGAERVCMVPIAFVSEHIETLHEIDIEYAEVAHHAGISHYGRAPALDLEQGFVDCLAALVQDGLAHFSNHRCARCLLPKPDQHRRRATCSNCRFTFPRYMREALPESG